MLGITRYAIAALAALCLTLGITAGALYLQRNAARKDAADAHSEQARIQGLLDAQTAAVEAAKAQAQAATEKAALGAKKAREIATAKPALPPAPSGCEQAATWAQEQAPAVLEGWR